MAVNLATKYAKQFAAAFAPDSFLEGRYNTKWSFDGVREIAIQSPVTVPMTAYTRAGANRYGEPTEMDTALQKLALTKDEGFTKTLDRGNYTDSQMAISAANWLTEEVKQVVRPTTEKYALNKWANEAGSIKTISAAPTKATITDALMDLDVALDNGNVSDEARYLYIPTSMHKLVALSSEFLSLEKLGEKAVGRGHIGQMGNMKVVKVPDAYIPANCFGLVAHKDAVILARKLSEVHQHIDPPGISGWLMEGRCYYDAFVLAAKANGVAALVLGSAQQAAPTIAISDGKATITASGASQIKYTVDGTDPRYSASAQVYTAAVTIPAGGVVKAVAYKDGSFASNVAEK